MRCEFNIVLKEKPLDEGLTKSEVMDMYDMLSGVEAIPVEFQGENSTAMGFINLTDAEIMNYDYRSLEEFVTGILNDTEKETPDGEYEFNNGNGVSYLIILR